MRVGHWRELQFPLSLNFYVQLLNLKREELKWKRVLKKQKVRKPKRILPSFMVVAGTSHPAMIFAAAGFVVAHNNTGHSILWNAKEDDRPLHRIWTECIARSFSI